MHFQSILIPYKKCVTEKQRVQIYGSLSSKVQLLWEGHKNLQIFLMVSLYFYMMKIEQIFVTFSPKFNCNGFIVNSFNKFPWLESRN